MSGNLTQLAILLGNWAKMVPDHYRKMIYQTAKVLSGIATVALLVLPSLPASVAVHLPNVDYYGAILTGALLFLSHLADSNLNPDPSEPDMTPAPETGNPTPPPGVDVTAK